MPEWLSRLCRHIESVATESVSLADLAKYTNLTPRALQYAFKQHLNTTPMRWVRVQRLKQVHQSLKAKPGKELTVTQAAMAGGFTNLGIFARYYREEFGEKPSETLAG